MSEFERELKQQLIDQDQVVLEKIDEKNYYKEVLQSLRGPDRAMNILAWVGILLASALLIYFLICAFQADTTREQVLFAALAVMLNSGQIGMKLWVNMRLNRRVVLRSLKRVRLDLLQAQLER